MNAFAEWFTPDVLRTLGLSLLHFLWQGAALAALSAAAFALVRNASARYTIGVISLVLMLAAPTLTFLAIRDASPSIPTTTQRHTITAANHTLWIPSPHSTAPASTSIISADTLTVFVELWFVGVMLFSLRTAGGFFLLARLQRREAKPISQQLLASCREMQRRLGITRAIRYCESLYLDAPAVVGWFRPVVLLPVSALTGLGELQLRAVIAHELAHIRRLDAFVNLFQVAVETLLFYHPAVWWVSKRVRAERENCCDDVALAVCGNPAEYARALAKMEEQRAVPSFAMAANRGPLASRVARLLGLPEKGNSLRNAGVAFGVLCLAAALLAGNALFGLVRTASAHSLRPVQATITAVAATEHAIAVPAVRVVFQAPASPAPSPAPKQKNNPEPTPAPKTGSYIDGMKAAGLDNLSVDELVALKIQGVTPDYIRAIRAEDLNATVDELIGMKVQGITAEYIHQVRAMKLDVAVGTLIGMKVQGITPEYVEEMRKLGFEADAGQLIGMKVLGVTPEYVREMNELNVHLDAGALMGMKVQGIQADYIKSIRAAGLNPDQDEWIALKVQDVTADYVKGLQAAGFKPNVNDVISAKIMGITPQFIELARSHGFRDLDLGKLIQLKHANVLE
jgi:beta-lactamase regulating signal transducer with metallopeptidase domain/sporulation protein YlmC with PRC-barrel domain